MQNPDIIQNNIQNINDKTSSSDDDVNEDLFEMLSKYWSEGCSLEDQESVRSCNEIMPIEAQIIRDVSLILNNVADKAERLINNNTTNLCESWMSVRSKFDGGKQINRTNRFSWRTRCYGASLRRNVGINWSPEVWKAVTGLPSSKPFHTLYQKLKRRYISCRKSQAKDDVKTRRYLKKHKQSMIGKKMSSQQHYGEECKEVKSDIGPTQLKAVCDNYYKKNVQVTPEQINNIKKCSVLQGQSGVWHTERKKRITASNSGKIIKRNPSLKIDKFVKNLLYSKFSGNTATLHGLQEERATITDYLAQKGKEKYMVKPCGFQISKKYSWLGGSPDGIICNKTDKQPVGLIEVKNLLHKKKYFIASCKKQKILSRIKPKEFTTETQS